MAATTVTAEYCRLVASVNRERSELVVAELFDALARCLDRFDEGTVRDALKELPARLEREQKRGRL